MQTPQFFDDPQPHTYRGIHLLLECWEVSASALNDADWLQERMKQAAEVAQVTIIGEMFHRFSPHGVTGVLLLAESHMSIHTWPENGYAAIDIYTCGKTNWPEAAADYLTRALSVGQSDLMRIERGQKIPDRLKSRPDAKEQS